MEVHVICPKCHEKMVYRGGNVIVQLNDDEIGKRQEASIAHCDRCGINQLAFIFTVEMYPVEITVSGKVL